jgi:hypothetical protein
MNNGLTLVLSIIGLLALYWVLMGQWKWNKMLLEAEDKKDVGKTEGKEINKNPVIKNITNKNPIKN